MWGLFWHDPVDFVGPKTTWMTDKNMIWLKKIKDDFLKKYIKNKNILNRPGLTQQTHRPGHELDWVL